MYNFDRIIDRKGKSTVKWDYADKAFGGTDLLPMWIADMDFEVAPGIEAQFRNTLETKVFGYGTLSQEYYEAVIGWMKRRHHYDVKKEWICYTPGIVSALNFAVEAITQPGEEVMLFPPVYHPFYDAVEGQGRTAVKVPLKQESGRLTFDFDRMEQSVTAKTRAILLCSPHNPVGRVWDREELEALSDFVLRHDLLVIDDEIHHDLVYNKEHTVLCRISPEIERRVILCTAPSKTFNLAGIQASNIIIPNEELLKKFRDIVHKRHVFSANSFVNAAVVGAYRDSEDWLDELLVYLEGNLRYFVEYIGAQIPSLKTYMPEGTYLAWVDCSGLGLNEEELKRFFVEKCGLALNAGGAFGEQAALYMRFNLACSRKLVERALGQMKQAIETLQKETV